MDLSYISVASSLQLSQLSKSYDTYKGTCDYQNPSTGREMTRCQYGCQQQPLSPGLVCCFDYPETNVPRVVESQFAFVARLLLQSLCCSH